MKQSSKIKPRRRNKVEISKLSNKEFKVMTIKMLNKYINEWMNMVRRLTELEKSMEEINRAEEYNK